MNGEIITLRNKNTGEIIKLRRKTPEQPIQPQIPQQFPQQPRTFAQYALPSWMTSYKEKPGERTLLGDIFERPSAAIRSALMGKGYTAGAMMPEKVPTFQEEALKKYYGQPTTAPSPGKVMGGFGVSALGLAADVITNPADVLLMLAPKIPIGAKKTLGQAITKTKAAQAVGRFATKERHLFFNDRWIKSQARTIQTLAQGLDEVTKSAYGDIYKPYNSIPVDPTKVDDILLKYNVPDYVIQEIENTAGKTINTVEKAKSVSDILRKRVSQTLWAGKTRPPGGIISPKVIAKNASHEIKQLIYNSLEQVDPEAKIALQALDDFASKNLYPKIDKLSSLVGGKYAQEPSTTGMIGAFRGRPEQATQRTIMRETPKTINQLRAYLATSYRDDINDLYRTSKKVIEAMSAFQKRQFIKRVGTKVGIGYGAYRLYRGIKD